MQAAIESRPDSGQQSTDRQIDRLQRLLEARRNVKNLKNGLALYRDTYKRRHAKLKEAIDQAEAELQRIATEKESMA